MFAVFSAGQYFLLEQAWLDSGYSNGGSDEKAIVGAGFVFLATLLLMGYAAATRRWRLWLLMPVMVLSIGVFEIFSPINPLFAPLFCDAAFIAAHQPSRLECNCASVGDPKIYEAQYGGC